MTNPLNVLTAKAVKDVKPGTTPYRMPDGGGLFHIVTPGGSKLWRIKLWAKHKDTTDTLGPYPAVSLAQARARRDAAKLPTTPVDASKDTSPVFRIAAAEWHAEQSHWSDTNKRIGSRLLEDTVYSEIGDMQMGQITKAMIFKRVVKPFEGRGVIERSERALGYIRKIFDWANTRASTLWRLSVTIVVAVTLTLVTATPVSALIPAIMTAVTLTITVAGVHEAGRHGQAHDETQQQLQAYLQDTLHKTSAPALIVTNFATGGMVTI